jgi:hypothetical protein
MTKSLKETFNQIRDYIHPGFDSAYHNLDLLIKSKKSIYYNTSVERNNDQFSFYYHGNKIITYTPNSIILNNIDWYNAPSTSVRVNKLLPKNIDICTENGEVCVYASYAYRLIIDSNGFIKVSDFSSDFNRIIMYNYSIYEGMELIKDSSYSYKVRKTEEWYKNYLKITNNKPIFNEVYRELFLEAVKRDCNLHLYIDTDIDRRNNVIVCGGRKLPALTKKLSQNVMELLKEYQLLTKGYSVPITLPLKLESLSKIEIAQKCQTLAA